jgi:alkaline phosphatase
MTHSLDSFITDSANSASALFTGKKMTVNGLNAYTDSTGKGFANPKVETVFEMFRRITGGQVGIVSKAYIADATPAAVCTHTSQRSQYTAIIEQYLNGVTGNFTWFPWQGVDLLFGGGAENFLAGPGNGNVSQFERWASHGYQVGYNNTQLQAFDNAERALGLFTRGNISTWLDQHVYKDTLDFAVTPQGARGAYDQPGLKEMTLKAIDILHTRAKARGTGFSLMSEAAVSRTGVILAWLKLTNLAAHRQGDARSRCRPRPRRPPRARRHSPGDPEAPRGNWRARGHPRCRHRRPRSWMYVARDRDPLTFSRRLR